MRRARSRDGQCPDSRFFSGRVLPLLPGPGCLRETSGEVYIRPVRRRRAPHGLWAWGRVRRHQVRRRVPADVPARPHAVRDSAIFRAG